MNNLRRYLYGGMIGMISEYLYRVGFEIIPLVILGCLLAVAMIDIFSEKKSNILTK